MSMETTSGFAEEPLPFVSPTVSKQQWAGFALRKLSEGFVLVQGLNGKTFTFVKAGEPPSPCAGHAARKLLAMGMLEVLSADGRGTRYGLRPQLQDTSGAVA